jgi:hypothetical protein
VVELKARLRETLGPDPFVAAVSEGSRLDLREAVARAVAIQNANDPHSAGRR